MKYKILGKQNNSSSCFICGMDNDAGTKAKFYACENMEGERVLVGIIDPNEIHQSYAGRMHGGVVSAILDEAIGRAVQIDNPEIWGVTMTLNVTFRKPTPLDETLYIEGRITALNTRGFEGEGKLFTKDGTTLATATAKYFIIPPEKIAPEAVSEDNWFYVPEDLPEFLEI